MTRGYRVWDNQEKTYSDKAFSIDQLGICYVQDEDGYWEEIDDSRFIVEFETELTDKNADMICEGDIVNISGVACTDDSSMACIIDTNSVVIWDEKYARFDVNDDPEDDDLDYRRRRYSLFTDGERSSVEVIGNIHENKELLGGEE